MTSKDWIYISLISAGVFVLTRKLFSSESETANQQIVEKLRSANKASLPLTLTETDLNIMQYAGIMMSEGQKQGMAPEIIASIMRQESSGRAEIITPEVLYIKDSSGKKIRIDTFSYGLMQVLKETAEWVKDYYKWLKYDKNPLSLLKPDVNIEIGTAYLVYQYKRYKNNPVYKTRYGYTINPVLTTITDMIASYNAGSVMIAGDLPIEWYYSNSEGDPKVQVYVDNVMSYRVRYRMIFEYLYSNYDYLFPASLWGY